MTTHAALHDMIVRRYGRQPDLSECDAFFNALLNVGVDGDTALDLFWKACDALDSIQYVGLRHFNRSTLKKMREQARAKVKVDCLLAAGHVPPKALENLAYSDSPLRW